MLRGLLLLLRETAMLRGLLLEKLLQRELLLLLRELLLRETVLEHVAATAQPGRPQGGLADSLNIDHNNYQNK